ncbi:MAG: heparinase II/III family protein [Candidatus Brocadiia bacterium]
MGTVSVCRSADSDQVNWKSVTDVEDVVAAYPDRIDALMEALELDREGLGPVREALEEGDRAAACKALLKYYRTGDSGHWLRDREHAHEISQDALKRVNEIVDDVYHHPGSTGPVPRTESGHLDWAHRGPKDDRQFANRLNRHGHINTLLRAYEATGKEKYLQKLDLNLRDWLTAADGDPAPDGFGRGILEACNRMPTWSRVFYALQDESGFQPATRLLMLAAIPGHADYIQETLARNHNFATMQMNGLGTIGLAFPEFKQAEDWWSFARDVMVEEIAMQVYPDGVQKELTFNYHLVSLARFTRLMETAQKAGEDFEGEYREEVEQMWNYVAGAIRPDGTRPMNGDSDLRDMRRSLRKRADVFDRPEWLYAVTGGEKGARPDDPPSRFFPWAGQLISRSGWDEDAQWSFFDVGPYGTGGHGHPDKLHLSVMARGQHLLVDTGKFAYQGEIADKFHKPYVKHSRSQNVILIDGNSQDTGPKEVQSPIDRTRYRTADAFDWAMGEMGAFRDLDGEATHARGVFYLRGEYWIVFDQIRTDRPRRVRPVWHFHPDCSVEIDGTTLHATNPEGVGLEMLPFGATDWDLNVVSAQEEPNLQGWYSPTYGDVHPADTAVCEKEVQAGTTTFGWLLFPHQGKGDAGSGPEVSMLEAPEGVMRVRIEQTDEPTRTLTAVLNRSRLPVQLNDGRMLQSSLLVETEGEEPEVVGGLLRDADGTVIAGDPVDAERTLQNMIEALDVEKSGEELTDERETHRFSLPIRNIPFKRPVEYTIETAGDTADGWDVEVSAPGGTIQSGEAVDPEITTVYTPGRPRYPLPRFTVRLRVPEQPDRRESSVSREITLDPPVPGIRPRLSADRTEQPPAIDGELKDRLWKSDPATRVFARMDRDRNPRPATAAWLGYDRKSLYVAFRCEEPETEELKLEAEGRDDNVWKDDSVEILLDPTGEGDDYYHVNVNAEGTVQDARKFDADVDIEGLRAATQVEDGEGWTAEVAIPWEDVGLEGPPEDASVLLARNRQAGGEHEIFQFPVSPDGNHQPDWFASLKLERQ